MRCGRLLTKVKNFLVLIAVMCAIVTVVTVLNRGFMRNGRKLRYGIGVQGTRRPAGYLSQQRLNNFSYCNFNLNNDLPSYWNEEYKVVFNVLNYSGDNSSTPAVTYATHVTAEFINYIAEIIKAWEGPISVAAFVPHSDADFVTRQLMHFCQCTPEMTRVSVHFVYPLQHPPLISIDAPTFTSCNIEDSTTKTTYRNIKNIPYPVNIARNVARKSAKTHHVLVSDVELLPSEHLASNFVNMLKSKAIKRYNFPSKVYVLPVFEVEHYAEIPRVKSDLIKLVRAEKALYFHRHVCSHCQKFPAIEAWLQQDPGNKIKPLLAVKREYPFHRWEPIYIGTDKEPFYGETLTWEGKQDKMTQMLEMCLMNYRFIILDGGFLIHWPGVKRKSTADLRLNAVNIDDSQWRKPFQRKNSRQYSLIVAKLSRMYKKNPKCRL